MATLSPSALPLEPSGKTEVRIASTVTYMEAELTPCKVRKNIRKTAFVEKPHNIFIIAKEPMPAINSFFLPIISASLPKGRTKIAVARVKARVIQFKSTELMTKSLLMEGRAMFTADDMNGTINAPKLVVIRIILLNLPVIFYLPIVLSVHKAIISKEKNNNKLKNLSYNTKFK
jgi:hypothetical protein